MGFIEKVEQLPLEIKTFLTSNSCRLETEKTCFLYEIKLEDIGKISQPTGLMFVGDIKIGDLPNLIKQTISTPDPITYGLACELNKRLFNKFPDFFKDSGELLKKWESLKSAPLISEEEAWQKVLEIEPWILEEEKNKEKELEDRKRLEEEKQRIFRASLVKIPLAQALKDYPELGEQLIASNRIELKNFPEPARPSIKNWLADYTFNLGNRKHNSMERNTYVFHGTNAKSLNAYDRQKLTYILRSFDENTNVFVNKNTKQVVFEKENEPASPLTRNSLAKKNPKPQFQSQNRPVYTPKPEQNLQPKKNDDPNLKFSFSQRLPYENLQPKPFVQSIQSTIKPTPVIKKLNPIVRIPKEEKKGERELGKNVVNLKE